MLAITNIETAGLRTRLLRIRDFLIDRNRSMLQINSVIPGRALEYCTRALARPSRSEVLRYLKYLFRLFHF